MAIARLLFTNHAKARGCLRAESLVDSKRAIAHTPKPVHYMQPSPELGKIFGVYSPTPEEKAKIKADQAAFYTAEAAKPISARRKGRL